MLDAIYPGLDLSLEICSVFDQQLGETVLLTDGDRLDGFAVCQAGAETEAGSGTCFVKFGAAPTVGTFERLLDACGALAMEHGAELGILDPPAAC